VRIISRRRLREFWIKHPRAEASLRRWEQVVQDADWRTFADVRNTFGDADQVMVASGETVVVFNIAGNHYRLVTSIKYRTHLVYTLIVMTHAEYSRNRWKDEL
jgi:mRNA interferase HigB